MVEFIRRIGMVVVLGAFLGAGFVQAIPPAMQMSSDMTMVDHDSGDKPMPCKGMVPVCMTDIGCIFMVGLPVSHTAIATVLSWSRVDYGAFTQQGEGLSHQPDLGPPIHLV